VLWQPLIRSEWLPVGDRDVKCGTVSGWHHYLATSVTEAPKKDDTDRPGSQWARNKLWARVSEQQERAWDVGVPSSVTRAKGQDHSAVFSLKRCFWHFRKMGNLGGQSESWEGRQHKIQESLEFAILICDSFHFERQKIFFLIWNTQNVKMWTKYVVSFPFSVETYEYNPN